MKPGHIVTDTPEHFAFDIERLRPWVLTAGPEAPATAKYLFAKAVPRAPFVLLARQLRESGEEQIITAVGTVRRAPRPYVPDYPVQVPDPTEPEPCTITIGVQCHAPYLPLLEDCLMAIDRQTVRPVAKHLVLDGCKCPDRIRRRFMHWTIHERNDGSPNPGRNLVLDLAETEWIWHVDADDAHPRGYLEGALTRMMDGAVGIVHADIDFTDGTQYRFPEGADYWAMRLSNYVDTASVWRVAALREAGGWHDIDRWDDWSAALRVTALGWKTAKNPVAMLHTSHPEGGNRNSGPDDFSHKWDRSYAVVCLLAGREDCWNAWSAAVVKADYPARTHFYFVDNAPEPFAPLSILTTALARKGHTVTVIREATPCPTVDKWSRHRHVAHLYNRVLPMVTEDAILFWEDDNIPLVRDPVGQLINHWECVAVGGICAMYETRGHEGLVCGSTSMEFWHMMLTLDQCRGEILPGWGFLPGGFAIYQTAIVRQALPFRISFPDGKMQGWDGQLSRAVRTAGFRLDLDGKIECEHRWSGSRV